MDAVGARLEDVVGEVRLPDHDGSERSLADVNEARVLLCFLPDTSSDRSHEEANVFASYLSDLRRRETEVVVVTPEGPEANHLLARDVGAYYPILSDEEGRLAQALHLDDDQRAPHGAVLVDRDGRIDHVWRADENPGRMMETILDRLDTLRDDPRDESGRAWAREGRNRSYGRHSMKGGGEGSAPTRRA